MQHHRVSDLHNLFDHRLVRADLGALQPTDVVTDPGDESELGSFAHGISRCDPDEAEHTCIIWGKRWKTKYTDSKCLLQLF